VQLLPVGTQQALAPAADSPQTLSTPQSLPSAQGLPSWTGLAGWQCNPCAGSEPSRQVRPAQQSELAAQPSPSLEQTQARVAGSQRSGAQQPSCEQSEPDLAQV
jgi:hypothetical protein